MFHKLIIKIQYMLIWLIKSVIKTEGTRSVLFGAHSPIHSIMVTIAWVKMYDRFPSWKELVCIFVHDIGYWGKNYITDKSNDGHAELGAFFVEKYLGEKYRDLILGHSSASRKKFGIVASSLDLPDEYSWVIAPLWWMNWNNRLEGFGVDPKVWKEATRQNLFGDPEHMVSSTELFHSVSVSKINRRGSHE